MDKMEMEKRCQEAIEQTGTRTTGIVANTVSGLLFDIKEWNLNGQQNLDEMELQIGRCYAALKMLELYVNANSRNIDSGILEVLSYA